MRREDLLAPGPAVSRSPSHWFRLDNSTHLAGVWSNTPISFLAPELVHKAKVRLLLPRRMGTGDSSHSRRSDSSTVGTNAVSVMGLRLQSSE